MTSPVKDGQVTSVPGGGKMIHHCDDEKLGIPEQIDMLEHDLDVIVKQLTELAGATLTLHGLKRVLSDLSHLSQKEQIEQLTKRNLELEREREKLLERIRNQ